MDTSSLPTLSRRVRQICVALTMSLLLVSSSGCALWGSPGSNAEAGWADRWRPPANGLKLSGVDSRARDIERNLGVR